LHANYLSAETLSVLSLIDDLSLKADVTYVVVDEAHCILDWGEDFRPEFRHIVELRPHISNIRMLAVTATASHSSEKAIAFSLGMREFQQISSLPAINANVMLSVQVVVHDTEQQTNLYSVQVISSTNEPHMNTIAVYSIPLSGEKTVPVY
jgi:ATP-dependent DNA helicase RecQ